MSKITNIAAPGADSASASSSIDTPIDAPIDTPIDTEWLHVQYTEQTDFTETYGFAGSQGTVNLEGLLLRPRDRPSQTLLVFMHPSSTLQLLPLPRALVQRGAHVLCAASRYAKNDAALIMEKVVLDLGAYVRHAKTVLGYKAVVIVGWSGGGSLAMFYQAEAENPSISHTPAGDPADLKSAALLPVDALIFHAAHLSRGHLLLDSIDPSVLDELRPDHRDAGLDLYDPANLQQAPYGAAYIGRYRAAQLARMRRITATVKDTLAHFKQRGGGEVERGFVVHRTLADPRYLDETLDPNQRRPRWCYLGNPETVNAGPVGLARFCTLRSWLSQWSIDDARADALACAARITVPLLVIENGADDAVPPSHPRRVFDAATTSDKAMHLIDGATHYYAGQQKQLAEAGSVIIDWLVVRGLTAN